MALDSCLLDIQELKEKFYQTYEVVVVGGGVFGTALAISLATKKRTVLLIERDLTKPDRIVGELLQPGGYQSLQKLNLASSLQGIDEVKVSGYVVYYNGTPVPIPYPKDKEGNPYLGKSFHHGDFVNQLRSIALQTENLKVLEASVNKLVVQGEEGKVVGVTTSDQGKVVAFGAKVTVVADGCFSKFRKATITNQPTTTSHFVGYLLTDCPLPYRYHGHVILTKQGPVLLYQIGTHDTRVLVDVKGKLPSNRNGDLQKYMLEKVLPELPKVIQASFYGALNQQKARVMPNSNLYPQPNLKLGLIVGGDAFNMRHPLTGGGMTVALNDVVHLSQLLDGNHNPDLNLNQLKDDLKCWLVDRKLSSSVINVLALALYTLFAANDPVMEKLQVGCFKYFQLGGNCVQGPVAFLSAVDLNPVHLTYHFFAVCMYSQYLYTLEAHSVWNRGIRFLQSFQLFFTGAQILLPILFYEFTPILSWDILKVKFPHLTWYLIAFLGLTLALGGSLAHQLN